MYIYKNHKSLHETTFMQQSPNLINFQNNNFQSINISNDQSTPCSAEELNGLVASYGKPATAERMHR